MARRRRKTKKNPTGWETALLTTLGVIAGGVGGFTLASWACARVITASVPLEPAVPPLPMEEV